MSLTKAKLTMGPVLYNWSAEKWRDFYFRIADESDIDSVYVGEAICSKRAPFFAPVIPDVIDRLQASGKEVILSTLALVMNDREVKAIKETAADADLLIEANDMSAIANLKGRDYVVGPFINVYNEGTLDYLASTGASRICLPGEMSSQSIAILAAQSTIDIEVQVFGRHVLALSARCYHARAHDLTKDSCLFVCDQDSDGMAVQTMAKQDFLSVNGIATMSHSYGNLLQEMDALSAMGVGHFRLSPQDVDMVAVAALYRGVLEGEIAAEEASASLALLTGDIPHSNGFYHGIEGVSRV